MKLYLSSYCMGNESWKLQELVESNKKAAIIPNAIDFSTDLNYRATSIQREIDSLELLDFECEIVDLKNYFEKPEELKAKINEFGLIWVRGGNTFILRRAMYESGFDEILKGFSTKNNIVYGGYSAGVCVLTPTLYGLELVDDPNIVPNGYNREIIWDGLGLIPYSIAPHYKSDHPESEAINNVIKYFVDNKMLFKALKDGAVIIESI